MDHGYTCLSNASLCIALWMCFVYISLARSLECVCACVDDADD